MRVDALFALVICEVGIEDRKMKLLAADCGGTRIKLGLVEDQISMALNGYSADSAGCEDKATSASLSAPRKEIAELCLEWPENGTIHWSVSFKPE